VFTNLIGTERQAANVRRIFRRTIKAAGLDPAEWTPRELRHSFVSLMSDHGVLLEDIAPLVGHAGTSVTEKVYRRQLRPVLLKGGGRHGPNLPARPGPVVTRLVTQPPTTAMIVDEKVPVSWVGDTGIEPVTSSV
jgi:hypothetical protein